MIESEENGTRIHLDIPNAIEVPAEMWPFKHYCTAFSNGLCVQCSAPLPEDAKVTRVQWVESDPSTGR